eukprot:scaffold3020_cov342-Prasinococcus_capsulatus_cf.AAC.2
MCSSSSFLRSLVSLRGALPLTGLATVPFCASLSARAELSVMVTAGSSSGSLLEPFLISTTSTPLSPWRTAPVDAPPFLPRPAFPAPFPRFAVFLAFPFFRRASLTRRSPRVCESAGIESPRPSTRGFKIVCCSDFCARCLFEGCFLGPVFLRLMGPVRVATTLGRRTCWATTAREEGSETSSSSHASEHKQNNTATTCLS